MGDTGLVALIVRTIVSLGVVLAIVAVAYFVAKRRAGTTTARPHAPRFGARRRSAPAGVEVVGRVGLSRGSAAVAVRFGDRIVLVSASEQGPTSTLSEMSAAEWDELYTVREPIEHLADRTTGELVTERPNFLEALRQATVRHA